MAESRTASQIAADKLDLKLFNLSAQLDEYAKHTGDRAVDEASRLVFGLRSCVQRHMHKRDKERTNV